MAGTTMEKEGLPNAGFWDQHEVFKWVQRYINLVGGDPTNVSAWGESAGAGSIMHHLVFEGGNLDPLFTRAITFSPAYSNIQDRCGSLEQSYKGFETQAGCAGKGLACLRAADPAVLKKANDASNSGLRPGVFGFGPAPDGKLIRKLAQLEFAEGMLVVSGYG